MKNKTTAAILAFFLGGIGVHRFYLGQFGLGFLYLIFCWTFIPSFIALVDLIIFLTMDVDRFDYKYNPHYVNQKNTAQPTVVINNNNTVGSMPEKALVVKEKKETTNPVLNLEPKNDRFEIAGNLKYEDYDFDGAIKDYLQSLNINPHKPEIHFKLACLYSLLEQSDSAFFHLNRSIEKGYNDINQIKTHDHLSFLRIQQPTYDNFVNNGFRLAKPIEPSNKIDLSNSIISQIEKLAKLKDQGILNEEEFKAQKSKLLNN